MSDRLCRWIVSDWMRKTVYLIPLPYSQVQGREHIFKDCRRRKDGQVRKGRPRNISGQGCTEAVLKFLESTRAGEVKEGVLSVLLFRQLCLSFLFVLPLFLRLFPFILYVFCFLPFSRRFGVQQHSKSENHKQTNQQHLPSTTTSTTMTNTASSPI